jgi:ABC-type Fe3+-siderophore transport system permease subunit
LNASLGWALAVAAVALGYVQYGWQGVALAVSAVVFWLLLQFTRALRAMRAAGAAPIGHVASAVMLHARLARGQRLMAVIQLTHSLGEKRADVPETYRWTDASGASVTVQLVGGCVTHWTLDRPAEADAGAPGS